MTSELYFQIGIILACISMVPIGFLINKEDLTVLFLGACVFFLMWTAWPIALPLSIGYLMGVKK